MFRGRDHWARTHGRHARQLMDQASPRTADLRTAAERLMDSDRCLCSNSKKPGEQQCGKCAERSKEAVK